MSKQLFFSHTWKQDNLGRETHKRVYELARNMRKYGWTTWFDEDDMAGNIDAAMASGIDNADVIIVCLTEMYCKKVNETARDPRKRDNCLKEWTYSNIRDKLIIPVIMEPCLYNMKQWPAGVVLLYLGSTLYIDATQDNLDSAIVAINKTLLTYNLYPFHGLEKSFKISSNVVNTLTNKVNNTDDLNCPSTVSLINGKNILLPKKRTTWHYSRRPVHREAPKLLKSTYFKPKI